MRSRDEDWRPAATLNEGYEVHDRRGEWRRILSVRRDERAPTRFVRIFFVEGEPQSYLSEALIFSRLAP